ncbi:MAG TPA: choice-of-anchor Q domain-containing protein, partial [Anaerolineales bacterium]|nr:choice-of-anchor Q domain-containing protein [Anaerolineales bacterium]
MRTTIISPASYKFLAALAVIAMVLAALPVMPAYAASITVTNVNDDLTNGNGCSLREAIINSNNNSATHADCAAGSSVAADVITLTGGQTYTLSLTGASSPQTGDLDLTDPAGLTITSSNTTSAKIDANDIDRVFDIAAGAGNVTFNYLTITNGSPADGLTGGGINFGSTSGTLNITNSTVSSNTAPSTTGCGAGLFTNSIGTVNITNSTFEDNSCTVPLGDGGGIYKGSSSTGTLNISGSTFSGNIASDNGGAAQFSAGTVNITNSTFHFNTAGGRGGAIQVGGATVTIEFSTFSTNADNGGGVNAAGAVQVNSGTVAINRSILANSTAGKDCDQLSPGVATITNSLVEINSDCGGTITSNADPDLGALASNGGPTQTMAIDNTSPAYNAAASCNSIATDQRGVARPQATLCDLGAFEFVDTGLPTVVSIMRAGPNPIASASVNYTVTFSESVKSVGVSDFSLNLSGSVTGASVTNVSPA